MRRSALLVVLALSPVAAFAGDPCPVPPKAQDPVDARIDAALAAPPAERAAHVQALAADAPASIARLLDRLAPPAAAPDEPGPTSGPVVTLDVKLLEGGGDVVQRALARPAAASGLLLLEPAEVERLLAAVEKNPGFRILTGPQVTVFDRQRAAVQIVNETSYISDFEQEAGAQGTVANPVVSVLAEGFMLDARPSIVSNGDAVVVELDVTSAAFARPIAVEEQVLGATRVQIQRPETHTARATRTVRIPKGRRILWSVPRPACADPSEKPLWLLAGTVVGTAVAEPVRPHDGPPDLPPPGGR